MCNRDGQAIDDVLHGQAAERALVDEAQFRATVGEL